MSATDFLALLPWLVLAGAAVIVTLAAAIRRSHVLTAVLALAGLAATLLSVPAAARVIPRPVTPLLMVDGYALFYLGLLVAAAIVVTLLAYAYVGRHAVEREEFYILLLLATLGAATLACSSHFASFFLGLEILSVGLYGLAAYFPDRPRPVEAALKYLVLAGVSTAFLLFGIALIYADAGTLEFARLGRAESGAGFGVLRTAGTVLLLTGIGFKLAVVPFHMWTPDVYEGAPAPVTAFIATVSKGGMFALLLRYFSQAGVPETGSLFLVLSIIAIASMFVGNLLALLQDNVKRLLAYSSIAHLGYFLVAFLAGGRLGALAATFYLTAYFVTILGAFGAVTVLSSGERDADRIGDYRGLFWRRPALALVLSAMLLSLAGIPATAGFFGKFYVVAAGASAAAWTLVISLVVTSTIGLFYYLRVLVVLYERPPETEAAPTTIPVGRQPAGMLALAGLTVLLLWIGLYPLALLDAIQAAVASLG